MKRFGVRLDDGREGALALLARPEGRAWRGRVVFQPVGGVEEMVDCETTDATAEQAQGRASIVAAVRFPHIWLREDDDASAA